MSLVDGAHPSGLGSANPCPDGFIPFPTTSSSRFNRHNESTYECQDSWSAYGESMEYLRANQPSYDVVNEVTLGFSDSTEKNWDDILGRVASLGANMSLDVRCEYPWAASVPRDLFLEYVTPYGVVNEGRSNWRSVLLTAVQNIFAMATAGDPSAIDNWSIPDVVEVINANLWSAGAFGPGSAGIVFVADQTPLIYDPMSVLAYGYASCTGVSIFMIDALRSVGIPARLAGTPVWNDADGIQDADIHNNHNWLEVWTGPEGGEGGGGGGDGSGGWHFIEALPAGTGETLFNPCDKWFCTPEKFANGTQVYASRWTQLGADGQQNPFYPMAWDITNTQVPGVDRTAYYQKVCNAC